MGFPTLGLVAFGQDGKVTSTTGGRGQPLPSDILDEPSLRALLRQIHSVPGFLLDFRQERYNPLVLINLVNALQKLGKEKALAAIDEYMRVRWSVDNRPENIIVVVLALMEPPSDGGALPMLPATRDLRRTISTYPVVFQNDVPFLLRPHTFYSGTALPVEPTLEWFRRNGQIRRNPLRPPDNPLVVLDQLIASPQWSFARRKDSAIWSDTDSELLTMRNQVLRLVEPAFVVPGDERGEKIATECFTGDTVDRKWKTIVAEFEKLRTRWDAEGGTYVATPADP